MINERMFNRILIAIAVVSAIAFFCSCSSTRKIKNTYQHSADSAVTKVTSTDSTGIVSTVITAQEDTSSIFTQTIEAEFGSSSTIDTTEKENDYEAAPPKKKKYVYDVGGVAIESSTPLKSVKVKNTGSTQSSTQKKEEKKQVTQTTSKDSTTAAVVKTTTSTSAEKKTQRVPWLQLGLIALITTAAFYAYYKVNPFVRNKRKQHEETNAVDTPV